ncbi:MAG: response regulator [Desulfobacteraceae bacterium]|nr:response regulator [Desulfobacteraceae bacterium]
MKQQITALLIEDRYDDFLLLKEVLESSEDISVTILHELRLESAMSIAQSTHIDVAIIDLSLPDSFGLDTFIRFHAKNPLIPSIILTGTKNKKLAFEAVCKGAQDYLYKGEPSSTAIIRTIRYAIERQRLMTELKTALDHVKQLQGMLPICSACKRIRDDQGYWNRIESYLSKHSQVKFSHGICPDCIKKLYPDIVLSQP